MVARRDPLPETDNLPYTLRMKTFLRTGMAIGTIVAFTLAAAATRPIKLALKLPSKSPAMSPALPEALTAGPVRLDLSDARDADDPAVVGEQTERGEEVYLWRAQQAVAPAVAGFVGKLLDGWSVRAAPDGELGLTIKLERYWVAETSEMFGSAYAAEVRLSVSLVDHAGGVVWTHEGSGTAKDRGADARASTCNELLSLALREALAQALSSAPSETTAAAAPPPEPEVVRVVVAPDRLLGDLVRLKDGGVADDVLVAFVQQRKLTRPLSVDEILAWKNAGIPDAAIKAAVAD